MRRASGACEKPEAEHSSGLVAYLEDEPVDWAAIEPRTAYPRLRTLRVPWTGRSEDKDDGGIGAVTCFCVHRAIGPCVTYPLAQAPPPTTPASTARLRSRGVPRSPNLG